MRSQAITGPGRTRTPRTTLTWLAVALLWLGVLGLVAVAAGARSVRAGRTVLPDDLAVVDWFVARRTVPLTAGARWVSTVASPIGLVVTLIVVVALTRWRWGKWESVFLFIAGLGGIDLIESAVKAWVARPRPPITLAVPNVSAHGFSFPSGHTSQSATVYGLIGVLVFRAVHRRSARLLSVLLATLAVTAVGCARLYLGVHWFSDVLAGWTLGLSWLAVVLAADAAVTTARS